MLHLLPAAPLPALPWLGWPAPLAAAPPPLSPPWLLLHHPCWAQSLRMMHRAAPSHEGLEGPPARPPCHWPPPWPGCAVQHGCDWTGGRRRAQRQAGGRRSGRGGRRRERARRGGHCAPLCTAREGHHCMKERWKGESMLKVRMHETGDVLNDACTPAPTLIRTLALHLCITPTDGFLQYT